MTTLNNTSFRIHYIMHFEQQSERIKKTKETKKDKTNIFIIIISLSIIISITITYYD